MNKYKEIICIGLLTGCSSIDLSRVAPGYTEAFNAIQTIIYGYENTSITPELVENIPFASMIMNIGNGPKGLMILESKRDSKSIWVSADDVYLVEDHGKITQTRGLNNNLDGILYTTDFSKLIHVDTNQTFTYYASFSEPRLSNLKLQVNFVRKEKTLITLFNRDLFLTLIEEKIRSDDLGWNVTNRYWIDDDSFIWKSEQSISPKVPKIFIQVTKKPSI